VKSTERCVIIKNDIQREKGDENSAKESVGLKRRHERVKTRDGKNGTVGGKKRGSSPKFGRQ